MQNLYSILYNLWKIKAHLFYLNILAFDHEGLYFIISKWVIRTLQNILSVQATHVIYSYWSIIAGMHFWNSLMRYAMVLFCSGLCMHRTWSWTVSEVGRELDLCGSFYRCQLPVMQHSSVLAIGGLLEVSRHNISIVQSINNQSLDQDLAWLLIW